MTTNKTPKVEWAEPPESSQGPTKYTYFWRSLRENPGKWAVYPGVAGGLSSNLKKRAESSGVEEFESVTREIDGERVGFVRYVGKR